MMRAPRVLIAGAFGQGNPGDESILAAFLDALNGCEIKATTTDSGPGAVPSRVSRLSSNQRAAIARAALAADLVVVTGTAFKTLHPSTRRAPHGLLVNTLLLVTACRALGRPVALAGVGAGCISDTKARWLARGIVSASGLVHIRDEESAALLRRSGVRRPLNVRADVAWPAVVPPCDVSGLELDKGDTVVAALSHLAGDEHLTRALAEALRSLRSDGLNVAIQPWQADHDAAMAAELIAALGAPVQVRDPPRDVTVASRQLDGVRLVVGLRFHSLVAAAAAGVRFVAIAHEPKLAAVARRFDQEAVRPGVDGSTLAAACRRAFLRPAPDPAKVEEQRALANQVLGDVRELAFIRACQVPNAPGPPINRWWGWL
jgi:polysaccharide pyruvyl transferase WcaK-like protein